MRMWGWSKAKPPPMCLLLSSVLGLTHKTMVSLGFTVSLVPVPRGAGVGGASLLHQKSRRRHAVEGDSGRRKLGMLHDPSAV